MDNFKAIYRILSTLEKAMDLPEFDVEQISAAALGISEERWTRYLEMMLDVGLVKGVSMQRDITGHYRVDAEDIRITLKGLEYLQENSFMKKRIKWRKGLKTQRHLYKYVLDGAPVRVLFYCPELRRKTGLFLLP